jgi:hypothetical protein
MPNTQPYSIFPGYRLFSGIDDGYLYLGKEYKNPIADPIDVFWDQEMIYPAARPIRVLNGTVLNNGIPAELYFTVNCSLLVLDSRGEILLSSTSANTALLSDQYISFPNSIINGDFNKMIFKSADDHMNFRWLNYVNKMAINSFTLYPGVDDPPVTDYVPSYGGRFYIDSYQDDDDAYAIVYQPIENVYTTADRDITVKFYAKNRSGVTGTHVIATSFTQYFAGVYDTVTGIAPAIHFIHDDFDEYVINAHIPPITDKGITGNNAYKTALCFNIWLGAGSDYNEINDGLNTYTKEMENGLIITDIQFVFGDKADRFERLNPGLTRSTGERYYESTYLNHIFSSFDETNNYQTYIAPSVSNFIPGFRFRTDKLAPNHPKTPNVTIYSTDSNTADTVYHSGVGDVAVTALNKTGRSGVGSISLGTPTVAGGIYKYHWVCDDNLYL